MPCIVWDLGDFRMRPLRLGLRLGLFQLSLGILGVLTLGLLNRLLIQDIQVPAALAALAIGAQELMGFTRAWFGYQSDRIPAGRLRRTPFLIFSVLMLSLLFGIAVWLVLQLAVAMQGSDSSAAGQWIALLVLVFVGIGTAVSAGGTAFSALIVDLTSERERTRLLAVVWSMRLMGVMLGTVLVNRVFGSACSVGSSPDAVLQGLERLMLAAPPILLSLGLGSVIGVERLSREPVPSSDPDVASRLSVASSKLSLSEMLSTVRSIPQAAEFMAVLCLFTFSMFLNDAVLEPYGAAAFGMNVCATTSLNAVIAFGFLAGLLISGFRLVPRLGMIRTSQGGAAAASIALALMLVAAPGQMQDVLRLSVGLFGLSLGVCIHACLNLMFTFVQPGLTAVLLGLWGVGYAYSRGLATVSGGGLLTLIETINGGNVFGAYVGVFGLQIICFLTAGLLMNQLDVEGFRRRMKATLREVMAIATD